MRIIARRTLVNYGRKNAAVRPALETWLEEVVDYDWDKPSDVIGIYPSADVITGKRFVFNIKGNRYRLVADIEFRFKIIFIVWVGTHAEYNKLKVEELKYVKIN